MIERNEMFENTAIARSTSHKVKIYRQDGITLYGASDIASACGSKAPTKWVRRLFEAHPEMKGVTVNYPTMTTAGVRHFKMLFVPADVGRRMTSFWECPTETRKWLYDEVFKFQLDPPPVTDEWKTKPEKKPAKKEEKTEKALTTPKPTDERIAMKPPEQSETDRIIDSIIVGLLQLKIQLSAHDEIAKRYE